MGIPGWRAFGLMVATAAAALGGPPQIGEPFPEFSATELRSGETITPATFRGKVVLVDFWATWCGPCVGAIPKLKALAGEFPRQDFEILGVSLDRGEEVVKRFVEARGLAWNHIFEEPRDAQALARRVQVTRIPRYMLIGRDGTLAADNLRSDQLRDFIRQALAAPRPADAPAPEAEAPAAESSEASAVQDSEAGVTASGAPEAQATSQPVDSATSRAASAPVDTPVLQAEMTDRDRERARRWMAIAQGLARNGDKSAARARAERLLRRYPDSKEAAEVRKLIESEP